MRTITFKGSPLTLVGRTAKVNSAAPDFKVVSQDLKEVGLSDFDGKIKLISSFPSLDTPVCDMQVKEFNKRAAGLSFDIAVIGISKDLPFAQKRFCQENSITNETVLSDYRYSTFGINYGLLIKELNLLARSVHIIDKNDVLRYSQLVPELTSPPDFEDVIKNLQDVIKSPALIIKGAASSKCTPCEAGTPSLPKEKVLKLLDQFKGWQFVEDKKLVREYKFKDFKDAKYFLDIASIIAEEQAHHPNFTLIYNKLWVTLTTHASGGLTDNDFIMAKMLDEIII